MRYVIGKVEQWSKTAPLSRVKVRGVLMGVYKEGEQPYSFEESDFYQSVIYKWDSVESATEFLRRLQILNGAEAK